MQTFDASKSGKEFMENGLKSFAALSKGLQAISMEAADYSRQSVESAAAAAEKMLASRSIEKALEAQADYMKATYEGFIAQATRMTDLCADMTKDACVPFESPVAKAK